MSKIKEVSESQLILDVAIKGLQDLKAEHIVCIDLKGLENAVCDYFLICTGNSSTHVNAIAEKVKREIKTVLHQTPWHSEGLRNAEWIIIDYVNTVVHIFQKETREYYNLEELWADAKITKITED